MTESYSYLKMNHLGYIYYVTICSSENEKTLAFSKCVCVCACVCVCTHIYVEKVKNGYYEYL